MEEKLWRTVSLNQQSLDYRPNAFATEQNREICRVGFKNLYYTVLYIATVLLLTVSCIRNNFI